jgi:hypothetical protein
LIAYDQHVLVKSDVSANPTRVPNGLVRQQINAMHAAIRVNKCVLIGKYSIASTPPVILLVKNLRMLLRLPITRRMILVS